MRVQSEGFLKKAFKEIEDGKKMRVALNKALDKAVDNVLGGAMSRKERCGYCGSEYEPSTFSAEDLRTFRQRRGLTLRHLSGALGYSVSYLSDMERGKRRIPPALGHRIKALGG